MRLDVFYFGCDFSDHKDADNSPKNHNQNSYIGIMVRVFANGPGELGSIPGRVIPKTLKMVLDVFWLNTQRYKVGINGKVEKSRKKSCTLPYTLV